MGFLDVGYVGVDEGIADVVRGESEGLAKEGNGFVGLVVLDGGEGLLYVLLVGLASPYFSSLGRTQTCLVLLSLVRRLGT